METYKLPLFSIVIANYNYGRFLEDAIKSVLTQSCQDFELIICDAASTDNSVEVIKKYANGLPPNTSYDEWLSKNNSQLPTSTPQLITWWCSEKDGGQSAAFNKGFSHARGRFLTWLNADDIFMPGALKAIKSAIVRHPHGRWFVGGSIWGDRDLYLERCFRAHRFSRLRADVGQLMVGGPSSFFEKTLWEEVGGVDESLHYAMDVDLWYRFYRDAKQIYYRTKSYVWAYRIHEDSKMSGPTLDPMSDVNRRKREQMWEERRLLRSRYGFGKAGLVAKAGKLLSTSIIDWLGAHWDTVRLKGAALLK